uniref:Uncharacterized protein n=1 Tax=Romanomermis culicivorax TaxID=13658 RepID=A0A915L9M1_ROMCU
MNFLRYQLINRQLNRERISRNHTNPSLDSMNNAELYDHYRFDRALIFLIVDLIRADLNRCNPNHALHPTQQCLNGYIPWTASLLVVRDGAILA